MRVNDGGIFHNNFQTSIAGGAEAAHLTSTMAVNSRMTTISSSPLTPHSKSLLVAHLIITMVPFTKIVVAYSH